MTSPLLLLLTTSRAPDSGTRGRERSLSHLNLLLLSSVFSSHLDPSVISYVGHQQGAKSFLDFFIEFYLFFLLSSLLLPSLPTLSMVLILPIYSENLFLLPK